MVNTLPGEPGVDAAVVVADLPGRDHQVAAFLRWHDLSMIAVLGCNNFKASDCAPELAGRSACKDQADLRVEAYKWLGVVRATSQRLLPSLLGPERPGHRRHRVVITL